MADNGTKYKEYAEAICGFSVWMIGAIGMMLLLYNGVKLIFEVIK